MLFTGDVNGIMETSYSFFPFNTEREDYWVTIEARLRPVCVMR